MTLETDQTPVEFDDRSNGGRGLRLRTAGAIGIVAGFLVLALLAGFAAFANSVAGFTTPADVSADAVVALTGGSDRIDEAVRLLSEGRAKRLLISGVHPDTTAAGIAVVTGADPNLLDCCVDLDRRALDTIGNARETRNWLDAHGFSSLIIVTSAYHMPRALYEFERALSGIELTPYPVVADRLGLDAWWRKPATASLLFGEYLKYIVARVRHGFAGAHPRTSVAASSTGR